MIPVNMNFNDCFSNMTISYPIKTRRGSFFVHSRVSETKLTKPKLTSECTCSLCEFRTTNECELYCKSGSKSSLVAVKLRQYDNCPEQNEAQMCIQNQQLIVDKLMEESNEF